MKILLFLSLMLITLSLTSCQPDYVKEANELFRYKLFLEDPYNHQVMVDMYGPYFSYPEGERIIYIHFSNVNMKARLFRDNYGFWNTAYFTKGSKHYKLIK